MFVLSPLARRLTYVLIFETFAIVFATFLLSALSEGGAHNSLPVAVVSSLVALIWNFIYNTLFEKWEQRNNVRTRNIFLRIVHAVGFEGGLVLLLIPLFMWWYAVGPLMALRMEVALLLFFLIYTFIFTWLFDLVVPRSVKVCPER